MCIRLPCLFFFRCVWFLLEFLGMWTMKGILELEEQIEMEKKTYTHKRIYWNINKTNEEEFQ